ncbi:MAG: phosphoribosylaminoimidazolesuccinocarboxamide synthase [Patescibacteria group bacterium]|nr:phosphoribosylaminoimidazolesuccinocarboxamide synthase [Patescibacteria group bacterium]
MPKFPPNVVSESIPGLERVHQGKVRDTYVLPGHPDKLLVVATDRLSIFDFVLPALVPQKGEILTAMNYFWRQMIEPQLNHDLLAGGAEVNEYLPPELRENTNLLQRAAVIRKLNMCDCEAIVRGYLTGSSLKPYSATKQVCGHKLPPGILDGDDLPFPIFTPTTKAKEGHDEHITADSVAEKYGARVERFSLQLYQAAQAYASKKGIILADTKFEWGQDPKTGEFVLADEVLTPDSSRFWEMTAWKKRGIYSSPPSYDKQFVREWGKKFDINKQDPCKPEDVEFVHDLKVPDDIVRRTTQLYRYIFWRLTGQKLESFQNEVMDLDVKPPKVKIEIVIGSKSDLGQMEEGLAVLRRVQSEGETEVYWNVISCHRNLNELARYAHNLPEDVIVIAGAGMAAALPGILKTMLVDEGKSHIPVLGVGFDGKSEEDNLAARLSIERVPGQPVLFDPNGKAYLGRSGFTSACWSALRDEFLPVDPPESKPALLHQPLIPEPESR